MRLNYAVNTVFFSTSKISENNSCAKNKSVIQALHDESSSYKF